MGGYSHLQDEHRCKPRYLIDFKILEKLYPLTPLYLFHACTEFYPPTLKAFFGQ